KFADKRKYKQLLFDVFIETRALLDKKAVVYVRTDHRQTTLQMTIEVLQEVFPQKRRFALPVRSKSRLRRIFLETRSRSRLRSTSFFIPLLDEEFGENRE